MADGGRGAAEPKSAAAAPPRPTISLPPRSTFESLFRGGADASPGPMTLVSSFFNDDPDSECRSFSQLLAGAMASPAAAAPQQRTAAGDEDRARKGIVCENRPMSLVVSQSQSPLFTVPAGLSPGGLLESPAMFSSNLGPFEMSHQQALAQVTAHAVQSQSHMHIQSDSYLHSTETAATLRYQMPPPTSEATNNSFESGNISHSSQRSQPQTLVVDKPVDDGYNWRKYGQKQVKGCKYPRSYYKCTHPSCPVKKKVERSLEGQVTEIIYKGQHNHQKPTPNRRGKEPNGFNDDNSETVSHSGNSLVSKRERVPDHETFEQLSGSSDDEEVGNAELGKHELDGGEPDPKRRVVDARATESTSSHRTVTEPRVIVQTTSEVDLLDDGYRWRKYGQKVVKGNPHPRIVLANSERKFWNVKKIFRLLKGRTDSRTWTKERTQQTNWAYLSWYKFPLQSEEFASSIPEGVASQKKSNNKYGKYVHPISLDIGNF